MMNEIGIKSSVNQMKHAFEKDKVIVIRNDKNEITDLGNFYLNRAEELGLPLVCEEDPISGQLKWNQWTEIKYLPNSNDSYKNSFKKQPLHTDYGYFSFEMPYSFFYCVEQAEFGGATTFFDVDILVNILKNVNIDLLNQLISNKVNFGRQGNQFSFREDYILKENGPKWHVNWNYYRAQDDILNRDMINAFKNFLDDYIETSGELKQVKLQPGDAVFFKDSEVLHGRNSFTGNRHLNKGAITYRELEGLIQTIQ
jgi:alpha-ketoglutarate-dependent taurine dioxygenase